MISSGGGGGAVSFPRDKLCFSFFVYFFQKYTAICFLFFENTTH